MITTTTTIILFSWLVTIGWCGFVVREKIIFKTCKERFSLREEKFTGVEKKNTE
jgi:hypothetical protein